MHPDFVVYQASDQYLILVLHILTISSQWLFHDNHQIRGFMFVFEHQLLLSNFAPDSKIHTKLPN